MNIFRLLGDFAHLLAKFILIWSIHRNKSAEGKYHSQQYPFLVAHVVCPFSGISLLTQAMYALVFIARYLDLFFRFISFYNTFMKAFYIASALYVLVLMRWIYPYTPDTRMAWQASAIILGSSLVIGLIFNYHFSVTEVLWSFSIALESVCVIPQLIILRETTVPTVITSYYLLALGMYRALYLPNWIYRYATDNVLDPIAAFFGILQTALYLDFAWVYYSRQRIKAARRPACGLGGLQTGMVHSVVEQQK
ncbi:Protein-ER retention receptor [Mycena venus]|uniref:Protein-ER retention receptor n=1 Tax=Mycena venus TaxID=2733690 RepID=A0A8H6YGR4_9AGAR|nr:Protein-ER retention receptor [Mycena venus]